MPGTPLIMDKSFTNGTRAWRKKSIILLLGGAIVHESVLRKIGAVLRGGMAEHGAKPRNPKSPK